jgi:AT-rich interactive domain-containing protein 2
MSFDLLGNIASHINLQDPAKDPLSSMLLSLVSTGVFSPDRFKVLRSLEILRELTKIPRNERIIVKYMESNVYSRMCELLTICDIMLLICTLECLLAMTGLGEAVCSELVRVKGSVSTLVSLVTVEVSTH